MSLDRPSARAIREPFKRPNAGAYHTQNRQLKSLGRFQPQEDMTPLAAIIEIRIRRNRAKGNGGSYVLGDTTGAVYVVAEESRAARRVHTHMDWYVGSYARGEYGSGVSVVCPSVLDILDDLRCHFAELVGFVGSAQA